MMKNLKCEKQHKQIYVHFMFHKKSGDLAQKDIQIGQNLLEFEHGVIRFVDNCKLKKEDRVRGPLNEVEIEESKTERIKETQRRYFAEEYDKLSKNQKVGISRKLIKLNPR
ncbi:hypothetical protein DPMN_157093 [Dreissena polymorpha]|uniref:Uncharacterized protein n=1 Tax=Dreissena polymorpha TaxID=45954 RepID=A0A9D4EFA8_DREPO|nr:hypothetical protein DPMN_157093 [Dreissena polymorpha]